MSIIDKLPRAARLFNPKDRRLLNVAVDHGVFNEVRNDNHYGAREKHGALVSALGESSLARDFLSSFDLTATATSH
jgi:DhnA family fructose-bisphosphate aldolase class Ia